jgi:transposase InsO family protein
VPDYERTPPLQELLQKFEGTNYLSSLDLSSAYLQVELHENSRKYTAFLYDSVVYQFKRVPYGFKNSLPAFMRALRLALGNDTEDFVTAYVDDILVHSRTFEEHIRHLDIVIAKLTAAGFTLNVNKCKFGAAKVKFLGHEISQVGVSPDFNRMEAILQYPPPKNQKQLRQFLGTCNFHNRFIVKYAEHVAPLLPLLKKGVRWKWTPYLQQAFQYLRNCFANSLQLAHPSENRTDDIHTDASKVGVSAILSQKGDPGETLIISTASRVLTSVEQKYSICELGLLAIVYALRKFRIYVIGHPVTVYTDNKALSFLKKCSLTSNRVTRWVLQLQEYDLQINHISGAKNFFADVLSRNPVGMTPELKRLQRKRQEINVTKINLQINQAAPKQLKNLFGLQQADLHLQEIMGKVQENPDRYAFKYHLQQDLLCCRDSKEHPYWRIMLPKGLELSVLEYVHQSLGHAGTDKCVSHIKAMFYIKNLGRKVRRYVATCDVCQKVKHPNWAANIEPLSHLPQKPGELTAIDFYGPLPTGRGGVKYLLVCLEVFTKYVVLYPLKAATTKASLKKITTHYINKVVKPEIILSDHGSQFTSPLWKETLQQLGITVKYSPIRHPASNPAERIMKELGKYFKIYCHTTHKKWPQLIPYIQKWFNESVNQVTGYRPVELLGEVENELFKELAIRLPERSAQADLANKILKVYARLKYRAEARRVKRKGRNREWKPQVGDLVLIKGQPVSDSNQGVIAKFQRPYLGPFFIKQMINPSLYLVQDEKGVVKGLYNLAHLKPYFTKCTELTL